MILFELRIKENSIFFSQLVTYNLDCEGNY